MEVDDTRGKIDKRKDKREADVDKENRDDNSKYNDHNHIGSNNISHEKSNRKTDRSHADGPNDSLKDVIFGKQELTVEEYH